MKDLEKDEHKYYHSKDNKIIIDLTDVFGIGNEPEENMIDLLINIMDDFYRNNGEKNNFHWQSMNEK